MWEDDAPVLGMGVGWGSPSVNAGALEGRSHGVGRTPLGRSQGQVLSASWLLGLAGRGGEAHVRCSHVPVRQRSGVPQKRLGERQRSRRPAVSDAPKRGREGHREGIENWL